MAKLSKALRAKHHSAVKILENEVLTDLEKETVFTHWHEGANHSNGDAGAFFTPLDLAWDLALDAVGGGNGKGLRIIDLCAGIGVLSYCLKSRFPEIEIVCVELNPDYVEVGRKLVPEAQWHCLDVMDKDALAVLGQFDIAVSNPPFGQVNTFSGSQGAFYTGGHAEFKVMEAAAAIANIGTFLIPQMSAPFQYSGVPFYSQRSNLKLESFLEDTDIKVDIGLAIDTTAYSGFKGVSITTEIVEIDFSHYKGGPLETGEEQMDLFVAA